MLLHRHFEDNAADPPKPKPQAIPAMERKSPKRGADYRAVVYSGTRNLYSGMVTAAKSLLYNANIDKVFFLIEDAEFPYDIPSEIECIDVSKQTFFDPRGPNYASHWTYMVLMRAALTKVFPELDKILSLDVDTIVEDDISDLWDIDMGLHTICAVQEYHSSCRPYGDKYWNAGVMLQDLARLRETGLDDEIIRAINREKFQYNEQCAINKYCAGKIMDLPVRYNDCYICGMTDDPAIVHYIGTSRWQTDTTLPRYNLLEVYRAMNWDDVLRTRRKRFGK